MTPNAGTRGQTVRVALEGTDLSTATQVTIAFPAGNLEVVINTTPLSATVVSDTQLKVKLTSGVISGPGAVNVKVFTPSGGSGDLGCSSGGNSSVLVLTVN